MGRRLGRVVDERVLLEVFGRVSLFLVLHAEAR